MVKKSRLAKRMSWFRAACGLAVAFACTSSAHAVQHLVRTSDDWQSLASRLRPGDQIILMPGEHRGASFEQLIGTREKPITIRGADPANPSTINADREGIRANVARHLVIKDLIIVGAKVNGIHLGGGELTELETGRSEAGNIVIRNVAINRTGPRGQRHGMLLRNLNNVRIEDCRFDGWGGAAIEIITCEQMTIARCQFTGNEDYSQTHGIRIRACTESVDIEECRFEHAGETIVSMGASSKLEDVPPALLANASEGSLAEAARINVQRCLFIGGACPIAFINAVDCSVRNCTFIRPKKSVFSLTADQADPRFTPGRTGVFGRNLIVWELGDLQRLADVNAAHDWSKFALDANVWWSTETAEQRAALGDLPGRAILPQTFDVDPQLDGTFKSSRPELDGFGH